MVPTFGFVITDSGADIEWLHRRVKVWIEEERERQAVIFRTVLDPMRRRQIEPAGQSVQHIADIADERIRNGSRVQPSRVCFHLQATGHVLLQYCQEAVVGMLSDAVWVHALVV